MLLPREFLLRSILLIITMSNIQHVVSAKRFNITLKAPGNTSAPTSTKHKSVHVLYIPTNDERQQGTIVGFEPLIQFHQRAVQQLTVHICNSRISGTVWYDDEDVCDNARSMLIYEWTPSSSAAIFRLSDDCGFEFDDTHSIILSVTYQRERRLHKEQSGIILYISTHSPRYHMATMIVGNKQRGTRFSCRPSTSPRLLYAVKNLNSNANRLPWRMHIIRVRLFGRKLVQPVFDSRMATNANQTSIEIALPDLFLMKGDYLLTECDYPIEFNCYFLVYYIYKTQSIPNAKTCEDNNHADLFKLIPSREKTNENQTVANSIHIDGSSIFLIVCLLLLIIWISIIIGCIIMRRIRGLVNFRTEPTSSFSTQKNKLLRGAAATNDNYHRTGEVDQIMQMDADHGGLMG
ncbi:unnamed protein product [Adineta ricciae]|uniref:Uncharacterized protein n=1 Tax=Adineta ricciae TaxID=249248 RepID=A0A813MJK6_ADIRI|nr:unnamed protein product [Adineta ricciae]CAF1366442.1 unnamed protein product [Adineta ricciae]